MLPADGLQDELMKNYFGQRWKSIIYETFLLLFKQGFDNSVAETNKEWLNLPIQGYALAELAN